MFLTCFVVRGHRFCPGGRASGGLAIVGRLAPVTVFTPVAAPPQPCLRRLTFFCLARKKSAKKRRRTRLDFYRTATTEAPKFVTSCKRTYSPKRNYPLQARQSNAPNLPLAATEQVHTIPTTSKAKTAPTCSPKLPHLRNQLPAKHGQQRSALPCGSTKQL